MGSWTQWNEHWFIHKERQIKAGEITPKPSSRWRDALKGMNAGAVIAKRVSDKSEEFVISHYLSG